MGDLTIIFLTANKVSQKWAKYHRQVLEKAIGDTPIIAISREPMGWGINLIQTEYSINNIYCQMLRGAKIAKTPYIAIAEDDTLYPKEHFKFRPPLNNFAYNMSRWGILTWGKPTYFWKRRASNSALIASRELAIKALEERFEKYPDGIPERLAGELGRWRIEKMLGVTTRGYIEFETKIPVINFNHINSINPHEQKKVKKMWSIQRYELPYWGKAEELVKKFV